MILAVGFQILGSVGRNLQGIILKRGAIASMVGGLVQENGASS
ncbi:hypothetical protein GFS31_03140 [Leptolyngbya sp. BL0902]|nr:hypothetical protein GFS31_03140 [Leptolyngbya sp. BL0902]